MRAAQRALGAVAAAATLLFGAARAEAFVLYATATGRTLSLQPCLPVPIVVYPGTFSQMTVAEVTAAVTAATGAWSAGTISCTWLSFDVKVVTGPAPPISNDHVNTIVFRDSSWCKLDAAGDCSSTDTSYNPASLVLTTLTARSSTGEIIDADIEVNAHTNFWADRVAHPELTDRNDLQNALTREIGHLIGLNYSCWDSSWAGTRPVDDAGNPAPDCATAPTDVRATTMFPSNVIGETERRTLEADDRAGACELYPAALSPCKGDGGPGCMCPLSDPGGDVDAGASNDASLLDAASVDGGKGGSGGGCGCETGGPPSHESVAGFACLAVALAIALRRRQRLS